MSAVKPPREGMSPLEIMQYAARVNGGNTGIGGPGVYTDEHGRVVRPVWGEDGFLVQQIPLEAREALAGEPDVGDLQDQGREGVAPMPEKPPVLRWAEEVKMEPEPAVNLEDGSAWWQGHEVMLNETELGKVRKVVAGAIARKLRAEIARIEG